MWIRRAHESKGIIVQENNETNRRAFLRKNISLSTGLGLGFLAASCGGAESTAALATSATKKAARPAPVIDAVTLATSMAVHPPVREPLPGVFASCGLETVYLVRCGKRSVMIDTGFVHTLPAHLDNFAKAGLDLKTVDALLTTHFHVDHTAALATARKKLQCPIITHRNNAAVFEMGDLFASAAHMPYIGWTLPFESCRVDHVVEDGDTITVGDMSFTVVHLPGHTPGCTGYLFGDGNLIIGDVVFPSGILGWNDVHWGSNYLDVIDTMNRMAEVNPKKCLPSHGLPWPYDRSTSTGGIRRAKAMLEDLRAGPMAHTRRAPLAEKGRTARHLKIGAKSV